MYLHTLAHRCLDHSNRLRLHLHCRPMLVHSIAANVSMDWQIFYVAAENFRLDSHFHYRKNRCDHSSNLSHSNPENSLLQNHSRNTDERHCLLKIKDVKKSVQISENFKQSISRLDLKRFVLDTCGSNITNSGRILDVFLPFNSGTKPPKYSKYNV